MVSKVHVLEVTRVPHTVEVVIHREVATNGHSLAGITGSILTRANGLRLVGSSLAATNGLSPATFSASNLSAIHGHTVENFKDHQTARMRHAGLTDSRRLLILRVAPMDLPCLTGVMEGNGLIISTTFSRSLVL